MPRRIEGSPASGKFYRSGPHAAVASNHSCRLAGLPNGSTIGACLEVSLLRKAASGSEAAMRMVSEWTAKPEIEDGEFCPVCAKKPPITFRHKWDVETESKNAQPREHELIEMLLHFIPPMVARPGAALHAEMRFGVPEYFWSGNDPSNKRKPPALVSQCAYALVCWLRSDAEWEKFLEWAGEKEPSKNV